MKAIATINKLSPDSFFAYLESARAQGMTVTTNGGAGTVYLPEREVKLNYAYDPQAMRLVFYEGEKKNWLLRWSWVGDEIRKQARSKGLEVA